MQFHAQSLCSRVGKADMDVVTVFLTSDLGEGLEDFIHDGRRITFDRLSVDGPRRLVDGALWVFVDWVMDDLAGLEMCRRLRADPRTGEAHVTMVLEEDDVEDRRRALKAGADDYVVGPLTRNAVLDRVLALESDTSDRRAVSRVEMGALSIDMAAMQARWDSEPIALRPNEFRLLRFFAENPNTVLSRRDLISGLGKSEPAVDERTVDVWIGRLRRAIKAAGGGNPLRTVRSKGYVLDIG